MKKNYLILIVITFFTACVTYKLDERNVGGYMGTPPGTAKIRENFFFDQTEVRNIDYLEFLSWTKSIFGENSIAYNKILPDSTIWDNVCELKWREKYNDIKFRHSAIVGISQAQAKMFCEWRSDRVFEFILIREGVLEYNPQPTENNYFTIEKYFTGNYLGIKPCIEILYYPHYELPDSAAINFVWKSPANIDNINNFKAILYKDVLEINSSKRERIKNKFLKKGVLFNLDDNVSEYISDTTYAFGMNKFDCFRLLDNKPNYFSTEKPNFYTGFRCVCKYKKWVNK